MLQNPQYFILRNTDLSLWLWPCCLFAIFGRTSPKPEVEISRYLCGFAILSWNNLCVGLHVVTSSMFIYGGSVFCPRVIGHDAFVESRHTGKPEVEISCCL